MVEKTEENTRWPSLFDPLYDPLRSFGQRVADWLKPPSAASGNDHSYTISLELPGVDEQDITLTLQERSLVVRGEKKTETEEKGETWYFSERQYGTFSRTFRLPEDADGKKAQASMKDGILSISIPRMAPDKQDETHRITISKN